VTNPSPLKSGIRLVKLSSPVGNFVCRRSGGLIFAHQALQLSDYESGLSDFCNQLILFDYLPDSRE
jgi:hypothetical protein